MAIIGLPFFFNEIFLTTCIIFLLLSSAANVTSLKKNFPIVLKEAGQQSFFLLCISTIFVYFLTTEATSFGSIFSFNSGVSSIKCLVLGLSTLLVLILLPALRIQNLNFFEFFIFFLLSTLALISITGTENLVFFYLVLEMQTLCFYVLATFNRRSAFSTEAGLKYFLLSSFMSAFLLLGMAMFYSCLGTLNISEICGLLAFDLFNPALKLTLNYAAVCIIMVLLFKIGCAPFHF